MNPQGYRFGMRQPAIPIKLEFKLPRKISFEKLDQWIFEALESDINDYQPNFIGNLSTGHPEEKYLIRWLNVTTILMQEIRVPVFEQALITRLEKNPDRHEHFIANIWFPVVDEFPASMFHAWLLIANELIINSIKNFGKQDALESFYQIFHKKYVLPWSEKIAGGKSTIPILQAAFKSGIPFAHCGSGRYVLGWGSKSKIFDRSSNIMDSAIGSAATQNKHIALQLMRFSGIPVPNGLTFLSGQKIALASLARLGLPLVVKPVDRDRGEGVTLGVNTEEGLQAAIAITTKLSELFLVEEQIEGTCHRLLVVDGKIIYAVKRNPKAVVGDGINSIEKLVSQLNSEIRNKIPNKRLPEYQLDLQAINCLADVGLTTGSVLEPGKKAFLRPAQSTQWGGDPEDVTTNLHPDNAELAIRAARLFGLNCAGVDFISKDIAIPWHQNGAVINEVNYSPVVGRTHQFQRQAAMLYMKQLFPTRGQIPIEVFIGESSRQRALSKWKRQVKIGKKCIFCSEEGFLDSKGKPIHLAGTNSVYEKIAMLRTDISVDAIVVHAKNRNIISSKGQPFEYAIINEGEAA